MLFRSLDDAEAFLLAQLDCSPAGLDADPAVAAFRAAVTGAGAVDVMVAADADEAAWLLDMRKIAYPAFEQLGPALLDDVDTTVWVPAGSFAHVDAYSSTIVEINA